MNSDRLKTALNVIFVAFLVMPMLQKSLRVIPEPVLAGVENRAEKTPISPHAWLSGKYARDFETRLGIKIGFRPYFVKLSNQIDYSLFGRIKGRRGTQVVFGGNNWLYEQAYIDFYLKNPQLPGKDLRLYAATLKRMQEALQARGIAFVLLISPSKVEIYPEYLPGDLRLGGESPRRPTIREGMLSYLEEYGISYVDANALFKKLKPDSDILFPPQGTHWNYYGSMLAFREVVRKVNQSGLLNLPVPEIVSVKHLPALGSDNDLELLLNLLWFDRSASPQVPYPVIESPGMSQERRADFLVVGDSFAFTVVDSIRYSGLGRHVDLLYYNNRLYSYPPEEVDYHAAEHAAAEVGQVGELPPGWQKRLADKDVVILEINEILLNKKGWGFIEDCLAWLR